MGIVLREDSNGLGVSVLASVGNKTITTTHGKARKITWV
jgi:hypothetical protein